MDNHGKNDHDNGHHEHYILPTSSAVMVGGTLLFLTAVTVAVAHIDLGRLNFFVAFLVATIKAILVCSIFMNLRHDKRENSVIFGTSFVFLGIFIVLTSTDLLYRGDVYTKGPLFAQVTGGKSQFKKPWNSSPELVAHGKALFAVQCVSCHGAEGKGDGPAASALIPHPRNFTAAEGWKNGRKPTMVFKTLKEGLAGSAMASFATLPQDDRWALAHFVLSLGPKPEADTPADFAKIGVDPNKADGGGAAEEPEISIALAMKRMEEPSPPAKLHAMGGHAPAGPGSQVYRTNCQSCHGEQGQGGVKVKNLGVNPAAVVTTEAFAAYAETLRSADRFNQFVARGLPGDLMPGFGQLSSLELRDLYQYVKSLESR